MAEAAEPLDHAQLLVEIEAEVRRRRESGELPADLEREMDLVFARYAPPAAVARDLHALLEALDRSTFVEIDAPVDSVRRIVPPLKRAVAKATGFQLRHVAQQIGSMGQTSLLVLRALLERIEALEAADPATDPLAAAVRAALPASEPDLPVDVIVAALGDADGRIAHVGAGRGDVVRALRAAGRDAYGIEADGRLLDGVDESVVRVGRSAEHLDGVAAGVLAGLVLTPAPARAGDALGLLRRAETAVRPGGVLVLAVETAEAWAERVGPVGVDVAAGRPLHPDTWAAALGPTAFGSPERLEAGRPVQVLRALR